MRSLEKKPLVLSLVCTSLLIACSNSDDETGNRLQSLLAADVVESLQGVWEAPGYGIALEISNDSIVSYDFTRETCLLTEAGSVHDLGDTFAGFSADNTQFELRNSTLEPGLPFTRIVALPAACKTLSGDSPEEIFEHTWHLFNDYYAFFAEREVDWLARYAAVRPRISDTTSDAELFAALSDLVEPIDDVHVRITADGERTFSPGRSRCMVADLITEFENQSEFVHLDSWLQSVFGQWREDLVNNYLGGQLSAAGGSDAIALTIANRFADLPRRVARKAARGYAGTQKFRDISLQPSSRGTWLNPVVLITSGLTASASEVLTLSMRALPHVTHIGETTNGDLSDVLHKELANGCLQPGEEQQMKLLATRVLYPDKPAIQAVTHQLLTKDLKCKRTSLCVVIAILNTITPSKKERMLWSPVTIILLACGLVVARG